METWIEYTNKDFYKLDKTFKVKLNSGKVVSIDMKVGSTLYDTSQNEIGTNDILFFAQKKDFNRYKKLQKHNETLAEYDFEKLDDLEYAIYDTYTKETDRVKITKIFEKLKKHISQAQEQIINESKTYL
jgi:hypothetical protein